MKIIQTLLTAVLLLLALFMITHLIIKVICAMIVAVLFGNLVLQLYKSASSNNRFRG